MISEQSSISAPTKLIKSLVIYLYFVKLLTFLELKNGSIVNGQLVLNVHISDTLFKSHCTIQLF